MATYLLSKQTEEYLDGFISFYNITNFQIENYGLRVKIAMSKFMMSRYMGQHKDNPISILLAIILDFRTVIWFHPEFMFHQVCKDKNGPRMHFVISAKYLPTKEWYSYLNTEVDYRNLETNEINFKTSIICESNVLYIGDKTFAFRDTLCTSDGVELAIVEMCYGLNDPISRSLDTLSIHAQNKVQHLKENIKPPYVNTDVKPGENARRILESNRTVLEEYIDYNGHANMAFYFAAPLIDFKELYNKRTAMKKLTILFKSESMLGDTLKSISWRDDATGTFYCKTTSSGKLKSFAEAEYYSDDNNLACKL